MKKTIETLDVDLMLSDTHIFYINLGKGYTTNGDISPLVMDLPSNATRYKEPAIAYLLIFRLSISKMHPNLIYGSALLVSKSDLTQLFCKSVAVQYAAQKPKPK